MKHPAGQIYKLGNNNSLSDALPELRHTSFWTCCYIIAYLAILVIGLLWNLKVICFLKTTKAMKRATNIFILNLAIADLFVITFCVIPTLLSSIFVPWILGSFLCPTVAFVQGVSVCASAYSLVAIAFDRFLAIVFRMKWRQGLSKKPALAIIACIWVSSIITVSPWLFAFEVGPSGLGDDQFCLESWSNPIYGQVYFVIGNFGLCYALPVLGILICNSIVCRHVRQRNVPQDSASGAPIHRIHSTTRRGVCTRLSVLTYSFFICFLPLYLIFFRLKLFDPPTGIEEEFISITMPLAQLLGMFSSCLNPILYLFFNRELRDSSCYSLTCFSCLCHQNNVIVT